MKIFLKAYHPLSEVGTTLNRLRLNPESPLTENKDPTSVGGFSDLANGRRRTVD